MTPTTFNFPDHTTGDTFKGITLIKILINSAAPSNPIASARIQFRKSIFGPVVFELNSADSSILINDSANWELSIPPFVVSAPAETYLYDLQTIDSQGNIYTYLKGSWKINNDITR